MVRMTGGEIVAEYLIREGVPYVVGIPGHGCLGLVDAFRKRRDELQVIQVRHEQAAVHLADGYYRARREPLAVFTSIGPGAVNTAVGVATAYVDSMAVLVLTSNVHTHMKGRGVLQEIERSRWGDFPRILEPIVKRYWAVDRVDQLPRVLPRAFNLMLTGRPGPVLIDLPMDVQCDAAEVDLETLIPRRPEGRVLGDPKQIEAAAELLDQARRPVILAGGGVVASGAFEELRALAEHLGAAVITTMMGKSAFPEDHPLYCWHAGSKGTTVGNAIARSADVLLAVGCRFADETTCSYRHGVAFSIPPTKLIQVDIDPHEIGKNYPVEVGIVGDARAVLSQLLKALGPARDYKSSDYFAEIQRLKAEWLDQLHPLRESDRYPVIISRVLRELEESIAEDTIVVSSSGNAQAQVFQEMAFRRPGTYISTGGFSTMGWSLPAAMGCKLAAPDRPVVAVLGDGDFLMTVQELTTAVQYRIPVVCLVLNNAGWQAITDLQLAAYGAGHDYATQFNVEGEGFTPNLAAVARAFGAHGERITKAEEVKPALERAFESSGPAVVEVMVNRDFPHSGGLTAGWWDVPVPAYLTEQRARYERERAEER